MRNALLVGLLSLFVFFSNLGGFSIYILDESKNASCAFEMMDRGDLIVPTFNGKLRTDKPPLHYYFMRVAYTVFGVNALAARFFSAAMGVLVVMGVYSMLRRLISSSVALYASVVMLSSLQFCIQFHLAVPDPYLIALSTLGILAFFAGNQVNPRYYYLGYCLVALGFLSKGLIAIVFPGAIFLIFLITQSKLNWQVIRTMNLPAGLLIFAAVALPWYVAVGYETNGEWLRGFFIDHNLDRYTATMEGHRMFPLAPFVLILVATLPFSVFFIQAATVIWKNRTTQPLLIYCSIAMLTILLFFSFSKTLLPGYISPAIPFMAILLGYYLSYLENNISILGATGRWAASIVNIVIGVAISVSVFVALGSEAQLSSLTSVAWMFLVLPLCLVAGSYYLLKSNVRLAILYWAVGWILTGAIFFYGAMPLIDSANPVHKSMNILSKEFKAYKTVAYRQFNPAFVFNLRKTIPVYHDMDSLRLNIKGGPFLIITRGKFETEFETEKDLVVLYRDKDLFEKNETIILGPKEGARETP